ncbi:hypothetical protein [Pseudonocardia lacus]|uniref:hypothetical protein n=1 Tax=Pseudonocardia lacus TaxID=2835865 RepID=UPI001BDD6556|nr:hypothetical protein [Pseudonocardia lacus]
MFQPATRDVAECLREEFAGVPRAVLEAEIGDAERELDGQVPAGSMAELLHRLVACRLRQRSQGSG